MAGLTQGAVRAAGGVVWRGTGTGTVEVVLVHRQRYDDWSLPKGKLFPGEHPLAAAVREVLEETGVRAVPELRLPTSRYRVGGTDKSVDWWSMRAAATDDFSAVDEVDEVRWFGPDAADPVLTYPHDRAVLAAFRALPRVTGLVLAVRHAPAGDRRSFPGPDAQRPLDPDGQRVAAALSELLTLFAPARVVSADPRRCVQTVEPLASALDLAIELDGRYTEGADVDAAVAALRELGASGVTTVLSSQRKLLPYALARLAGTDPAQFATDKGAGWILAFRGAELIAAEALDARLRQGLAPLVVPGRALAG